MCRKAWCNVKRVWRAKGTFDNIGMERGKSLWIKERNNIDDKTPRPMLKEKLTTEVAVIGAGMAGILTAYLLKEQGIPVVIIEANEIGNGITKNTTAKISSQHGLIYDKLLNYKGYERAQQYANANQLALKKYDKLIMELKIDCDYEVLPNYVYTLDNDKRIVKEVDAARKLGLPAHYTKETTLPFPVQSAIRFDSQAQFHPLKFIDALAKDLIIYEHTKVKEIRNNGLLITEYGSVKANYVVVATHYPIINVPGFYFLKMHQERYYVVALEGYGHDRGALDGMYLDADPQGFSFRRHKDYILLGGGNHRTGKYKPLNAYGKIADAANRWYPDAKIKYIWSNQDCMTPDLVPYIGHYSTYLPNFYVATGFNKWGMTSAMVSAMIIRDMVTETNNSFREVFTPRRFMLSGTNKMLQDVSTITISLLSELFKVSRDQLDKIPKGRAGIIKEDGQKIGVYRDKEDKYYYVSTKCPHLGCSLEWNQNELTWDCPCHGSRFDYKGNLINNPATRDTFIACQRSKSAKF